MKKLCQVAVLVLLLSPSRLTAQPSSDEWQFMLTPFFWGVGMDGTLGIAGRETDVEVSAKDLLKSLDFGFMANFEARKNRWSFAADTIFADLGKEGEARLPSELPGVEPPKLDVSLAIIEGTLGYHVAESVDFLSDNDLRKFDANFSGFDAGLTFYF